MNLNTLTKAQLIEQLQKEQALNNALSDQYRAANETVQERDREIKALSKIIKYFKNEEAARALAALDKYKGGPAANAAKQAKRTEIYKSYIPHFVLRVKDFMGGSYGLSKASAVVRARDEFVQKIQAKHGHKPGRQKAGKIFSQDKITA